MFGRATTRSVVAHVTAFEAVPEAELAILDSLSTVVDVAAGRVLMREGAHGSEAFIVARGELLIERGGEPVAVVGPGAVVGEMALLRTEPRNATVTAAGTTQVLTLTRREFATVLERCPTLARRFLTDAVKRAVKTLA